MKRCSDKTPIHGLTRQTFTEAICAPGPALSARGTKMPLSAPRPRPRPRPPSAQSEGCCPALRSRSASPTHRPTGRECAVAASGRRDLAMRSADAESQPPGVGVKPAVPLWGRGGETTEWLWKARRVRQDGHQPAAGMRALSESRLD